MSSVAQEPARASSGIGATIRHADDLLPVLDDSSPAARTAP